MRDSHQYLSYEEERGMDREFEAHQDRLAQAEDDRMKPDVSRENQKPLECYVVGGDEIESIFVVASDGVGRYWFDTIDEARADFGDVPVHYVETADE